MTSVEALLQARKELEAAFQRDIEAIDYLLTRLGHSAALSAATAAPRQERKSEERRARTSGAPTKPGSLRDWTERAFSAHSSEHITAPTIYEWAVANGAAFQAEREQTLAGFGNVLRQMTTEGKIRVAIVGSGRRPSTYEWIGELPYQVGQQEETLNLSAA